MIKEWPRFAIIGFWEKDCVTCLSEISAFVFIVAFSVEDNVEKSCAVSEFVTIEWWNWWISDQICIAPFQRWYFTRNCLTLAKPSTDIRYQAKNQLPNQLSKQGLRIEDEEIDGCKEAPYAARAPTAHEAETKGIISLKLPCMGNFTKHILGWSARGTMVVFVRSELQIHEVEIHFDRNGFHIRSQSDDERHGNE